MKNKLNYLLAAVAITAAATGFLCSCGGGEKKTEGDTPKYLWMCAEANFERFATKDSIDFYLDKIVETGFNHIVVDIKPIQGKVLYDSEVCEQLTTVHDTEVNRDWDYFGYFLDRAHDKGLKVVASACVFPAGSPWWHKGLCYDDTTFMARTCVQYKQDGTLQPIYEDSMQVAAFLNPARQDNRDFAMGILTEIMHKYDIDGLALDYCRFPDTRSDFSPESKALFEQYVGETIENFPEDIYTYAANPEAGDSIRVAGKYYKQWWAWRAGIISDFIHQVSDSLKSIRPDAELDYWAASWIHALQGHGQNWASPRSSWVKAYPEYGSDEYQAAGFAPYLDNFIAGTYLERVYGPDDNESVEYGLARADTLLKGDCNLVGSIYAINHDTNMENPQNIYNAVTCCLDMTGGAMVFDVVQVIEMDQWEAIKKAFDDYDARTTK
ncbi:MAG: family 10 glycosylhydrolase [Clostridiales bacterium]|nr:family 10 glycosylhydrolase [Clostridiales bacterium]